MQVLFGVYQPKNDTVALAPSRPSAFDLLVIGVCAMMDAYASRCVCARRKHRTSRSVVGAESGETTNDCKEGSTRVQRNEKRQHTTQRAENKKKKEQGGRESASRGIRVERRKMTGNSD